MVQSPYSYPVFNPYIQQSGTNDIQGVRWVAGIEEVKVASVPFGKSLFMSNKEQEFFVKDSNGSIKSFKFEEIPEPTPENFVTRKEFDELRSKYESLIQQSANVQQSQPIPNYGSNEELSGNTGASQGGVLQTDGSNGYVQGTSGPNTI